MTKDVAFALGDKGAYWTSQCKGIHPIQCLLWTWALRALAWCPTTPGACSRVSICRRWWRTWPLEDNFNNVIWRVRGCPPPNCLLLERHKAVLVKLTVNIRRSMQIGCILDGTQWKWLRDVCLPFSAVEIHVLALSLRALSAVASQMIPHRHRPM